MDDTPMCGPPPVTVLIAAHDRLPLLRQSLKSALAQDYPCFKVLVIDDGSGKETRDWLQRMTWENHRLRVLHQPHQGVANSRQNGLLATTTPLVCILDSDDLLQPHTLSRICEEFENKPEIDCVYVDNVIRTPGGREKRRRYPRYSTSHEMLKATLLRPRIPFKHSGTTFRREVGLSVGGYDRSLPMKIDIDLFLKFLAAGKVPTLISEPLVIFRMHRDSISAARWRGIRVWWHLVAQYGPRQPMKRICYQLRRTFMELLKMIYSHVFLR